MNTILMTIKISEKVQHVMPTRTKYSTIHIFIKEWKSYTMHNYLC